MNTHLPHRGHLPHRLRLLCISPSEPPWALLSLRLDAAGCAEAEFRWQSRAGDALAVLRSDRFDALLVCHDGAAAASEVTAFVEGLRSSGTDDAVVVMLAEADDDQMLRYDELDCEVLVTPHGWHSRCLIAALRRSLTRREAERELRSLEQTVRRQHARERDEAESLLQQQRELISHTATSSGSGPKPAQSSSFCNSPDRVLLPPRARSYYQELLRSFVMMSTGSLHADIRRLAEILALGGIAPQDVITMHLDEVEQLIAGLGSRSSRHILARADILALELMIHLGECYRQKAPPTGLGDAGVDLLHADTLLQKRETKSTIPIR